LLSRVIDVVEPALGGVIRGVICRSSSVSSVSLEWWLSDLDQSGRLDRRWSDEPCILCGFSPIIPVASNPSILS